ncbi:MAG: hypothetical protein J6C33_04955 [Lachnospiraceae bacterium]|nr:hypothetical protein [Lachnospiraceae bacterium]
MSEKYYNPLSDMGRIKADLMSLFCDSEDITRLIMPNLDDADFTREQNWYGGAFTKDIKGQPEEKTLTGHCFDTPYIEGMVADNKCAVFLETYLSKAGSQHIKEVAVDIMVVCHKDAIRLSAEDTEYYESIGVYGNRVDSAIQVINSSVSDHGITTKIKEKYSIGGMNFIEKDPLQQYVPGTKFYGKVLHYTYQAFYQRKNNVRQAVL